MEGEEKLERISCRSGLVRDEQGFSVGSAGWPWAPREEEAAGSIPWAPCAAPPQSRASLENQFAGIWSTQGRQEVAQGHG